MIFKYANHIRFPENVVLIVLIVRTLHWNTACMGTCWFIGSRSRSKHSGGMKTNLSDEDLNETRNGFGLTQVVKT